MPSQTYRKILQYTGNPDQVFYAQRMTAKDGRADCLEIIDVDNGSGLHFWILPGRCMDIGRLSFCGMNLSFLSMAGFSNSAFYESGGMNGIHTFAPGFLTTCGLRNSGLPCTIGGESFGFHGRIGQTPADAVSIQYDVDRPTPCIHISGRVREGWLFGPHLELNRVITIFYGENKIQIEDKIINLSASPEPIMMLYHFNFGYPFLSEHSRFVTSHLYEKPVDSFAKQREDQRNRFSAPIPNAPENCFYYRQQWNPNHESFAGCINEELNLAVMVCSDPNELPLLCNWQSRAAGDYAMGIEPCTCYGDGRENHLKRGQLITLEPYEEKAHHLTVRFLTLDTDTQWIKANCELTKPD